MNPAHLQLGALVGLNPGSTHRRSPTSAEHARLQTIHGEALAAEMMRGSWTFEGWDRGLARLSRVGEPEATVVVHHNDLRAAPIDGHSPWRRGPVSVPVSTRCCLLQVLLAGPGHGGGVMARFKAAIGFELEQGSVYPTLRALARDGLVEATQRDPQPSRHGGRPVVTYRLTPEGVAQARKDRELLAALAALEDHHDRPRCP